MCNENRHPPALLPVKSDRTSLRSPASFGCGCAALKNYNEKSIIFAKIFRLQVCSICQYLLFWSGAVRSLQCNIGVLYWIICAEIAD